MINIKHLLTWFSFYDMFTYVQEYDRCCFTYWKLDGSWHGPRSNNIVYIRIISLTGCYIRNYLHIIQKNNRNCQFTGMKQGGVWHTCTANCIVYFWYVCNLSVHIFLYKFLRTKLDSFHDGDENHISLHTCFRLFMIFLRTLIRILISLLVGRCFENSLVCSTDMHASDI